MHRLYLLRHAEAVRGKPGGADFDRPLSERGRREAIELGRRMRAEGHRPSLTMCSSAKRTRETWQAVTSSLGPPLIETLYLPELYRGDAADYRVLIAATPAEGPLLVVGHNPMMEELALTLVRGGDTGFASLSSGFPTSGLAVLDFAEPLWQIAPRTGILTAFIRPDR